MSVIRRLLSDTNLFLFVRVNCFFSFASSDCRLDFLELYTASNLHEEQAHGDENLVASLEELSNIPQWVLVLKKILSARCDWAPPPPPPPPRNVLTSWYRSFRGAPPTHQKSNPLALWHGHTKTTHRKKQKIMFERHHPSSCQTRVHTGSDAAIPNTSKQNRANCLTFWQLVVTTFLKTEKQPWKNQQQQQQQQQQQRQQQ